MGHGTSTAYNEGCRCDVCRAGRAAYQREWRRKNPDSGKMPRDCLTCGKVFMAWPHSHQPKRGRVSVFCSRTCAGNEPGTAWRQMRLDPGHPLATTTGKVLVYRRALYDVIGPGDHPCHWCGATVTWNVRKAREGHRVGDLVVDHLDSNAQNNSPENLVPSCSGCNGLRGMVRVWQLRTGKDISALRL